MKLSRLMLSAIFLLLVLIPSTVHTQSYIISGGINSVTGSGGISCTAGTNPNCSLTTTAVTPGAYVYSSLTVDANGRLTTASSGNPVTQVTGTAPISCTAGSTPACSINNTAVTPGSYTLTNLTVDAQGRITAAASGSGLSSPLTTKGDLWGYTTTNARVPVGANGALPIADSGATTGISWLLPATAAVTANESTSSTTYTDLTTVGPAVTVTIGASGTALVFLHAYMTGTATAANMASYAVSGATTLAASDATAIARNEDGATFTISFRYGSAFLQTGLTAGSNTFTMKYRTPPGGTANFAIRKIVVIPF